MNREVEKFSSLSTDWWKADSGSFKVLHKINLLRFHYIDNIISYFKLNKKEISILDVGCGGGILTERFIQNGYNILGIDLSDAAINEALAHSSSNKNSYKCIDVSMIQDKFDIILIMEVLEHVENIEIFLLECIHSLKEGGIIFFSTINKTVKSFLYAIIAAEYILKMLPKNTHRWEKLIKPSLISEIIANRKMNIKELKGMQYNFLLDDWKISNNISVNYIGYAK